MNKPYPFVSAHDAVRKLISVAGDDPAREGLKDTPRRVIAAFEEMFSGYHVTADELQKLATVFEDGACDEMVVLRDIEFTSYCEHHMMPFLGRAAIGYIPNKKVIGVSKLARLLNVFTARLQIQERIGDQVTESLMKMLSPEGCGCVLEAQHLCMICRGVMKQNAVMITSSLRGSFREDPAVRAEFLKLAKE